MRMKQWQNTLLRVIIIILLSLANASLGVGITKMGGRGKKEWKSGEVQACPS